MTGIGDNLLGLPSFEHMGPYSFECACVNGILDVSGHHSFQILVGVPIHPDIESGRLLSELRADVGIQNPVKVDRMRLRAASVVHLRE